MLEEFYKKNEVPEGDQVLLAKNVVFVTPSRDFDITPWLEHIGLSSYEVAVIFPKDTVNMLAEICAVRAKFVLQVGRRFFKKFPYAIRPKDASTFKNEVIQFLPDSYVALHHHDEYSIRDALGTVKKLVELLKKQRRSFCCVTNHGSVGGWIRQYKACKSAGIKPVFGMEAYYSDYRGDDPELKKVHRSANHMILLAKTKEGFDNIIRIHNDAQTNGFYYSPRADRNAFEEWGKGIAATSACMAGEIPRLLSAGEHEKAVEAYNFYSRVFDDFYIELQMIEYEQQREVNRLLVQFAKKVGAPVVLASDSHYLEQGHDDTHNILMCIRQHKTVMEQKEADDVWSFDVGNLFYRNADQMGDIFYKGFVEKNGDKRPPFQDEIFTEEVFKEAMYNTLQIARATEDIELDSTIQLPRLSDDGKSTLRKKINDGFKSRELHKKSNSQEYIDRVNHEFGVITKLGWTDYFLICDRIISDARKEFGEWVVGYGRGSAAGSLISYCLGITDIDPLEHGLLFERFIDENRADPPDIDIDFDPRYREAIKKHIVELFGEDNVCSIGTYQTYKTRAVILDVARTLGYDVYEANEVTKKIDPLQSFENEEGDERKVDDMSFDELCEHFSNLKDYFEKYPDVRYHADILRNQVKNMGTHAGGVIISDKSLKGRVPVLYDKPADREKRKIVSAWAEGGSGDTKNEELTAVGLIKFDILGLKNLPVVGDCVRLIKETQGIDLRRADIPIDDREAIKKSSKDDLVGIFQLENPATKPVADAVRLESLADVSALTSLIRPGPRDMGMDMTYARRKHGEPYDMPEFMRNILAETQGVIVYQEAAMTVAQQLAGFGRSESYKFVKAIAKKIPTLMAEFKSKFIAGAKPRIDAGEITLEGVNDTWNLLETFAGYGFNKSVDINTLICYCDGRVGRIVDAREGERVWCYDGDEYVETKVVGVHDHGVLPAFEFTFDDMSRVTCSANHKFLTLCGQVAIKDIVGNGLNTYAKEQKKLDMSEVWSGIPHGAIVGVSSQEKGTQHEWTSQKMDMCWLRYRDKGNSQLGESSREMPRSHCCGKSQQSQSQQEKWIEEGGSKGFRGGTPTSNSDGSKGVYDAVCFAGEVSQSCRFEQNGEVSKKIIRDSQKNICTSRYSKKTSGYFGEVEKRTPRRSQENSLQNASFSEGSIQGGGVVVGSVNSNEIQMGCSGKVWRENQASGFCKERFLDRGGWMLALRHGFLSTAVSFMESARTRHHAKFRGGAKTPCFCSARSGLLEGEPETNFEKKMACLSPSSSKTSDSGSVSFRKVLHARFVGFRHMCDLEVCHPSHNFVLANGLITSNSHAVAYSALSTIELWLKYNYPLEFICSLINNTPLAKKKHGQDVFVTYVNYARRKGFDVLSPDVSKSKTCFTIRSGKILFSISHVKNVASMASVIESFQPFVSMDDFYERVKTEVVSKKTSKISHRRPNKKVMNSLIASNAFSAFGDRNEVSTEYYRLRNKKEEAPQNDENEWVSLETEMIGLCLSKPPICREYAKDIKKHKLELISQLNSDKKKCVLFCQIESVKPHTSRAGNNMYMVHATDGIDSLNFWVFRGAMEFFRDTFKVGMIVGMPLGSFDEGDMRFFDDRQDSIVISE